MPTAIRFMRGAPPPEAFPIADIAQCATDALAHHGATLLNYHPAQGLLPLREYLAAQSGAGPEQVLVGNGSLQIMHFIAQLLAGQPGDRVLVEAPSYDWAIKAYRRAGAEVSGVPLVSDGPDLERLEAELLRGRVRLFYVIPDFQNPSGVTMSLATRQRLVELARRHGFWIVEDSPYRALRYRGADLPTIRQLAPERTLHLSSLSKLLSPGLRVGWVIGPAEAIKPLVMVADETYVTPNMLSQGIACEYLCSGRLEPNIARLRQLYAPRLEAMLKSLARHLPAARYAQPDGGFFIGVHLPGAIEMADLLPRAAANDLLLTDGRGFFPGDDGRHFLRLPFCNVTPAEMDEGLTRLAGLLA